MATTRSKTTKTATKKTTKAATEKKPAVKKAPAKPRATAKAKAPKGPTAEERIEALEKKLDVLIAVIHHNFSKDLVKGPKDLATKMRRSGLLD